jgi:hypothetical protein
LLRTWSDQGAEKFQKLFFATPGHKKFQSLLFRPGALTEERGMGGLALFRAKPNPFAAVPLTILPNKSERKFGDDALHQWCLNDRVQMMQPSATSIKRPELQLPMPPCGG